MLLWLDNFTQFLGLPYVGWRSLSHAVDLETKMYIKSHSMQEGRKDAHRISQLVRQYNRDTDRLKKPTPKTSLTLNLVVVQTLADDYATKGQPNHFPIEGYVAEFFVGDRQLVPTLEKTINLAEQLELQPLAQELERLKAQIPTQEDDQAGWQSWATQLNEVTKARLAVGQEVELSVTAQKRLQDYQYACKVLMDCVQGDSYASKQVRDTVVNCLLLPREKTPIRSLMEF